MEMGQDLDAPYDCKQLHEDRGVALVGTEPIRSEGEDYDGTVRPLPVGRHED